MNFWRQLRWRIVAAQMVVVIVGVVILALAANAVVVPAIADDLQPLLSSLLDDRAPPAPQAIHDALLDGFRRAVTQALAVAALAATFAGIVTSLLLTREILRPLRQIASSSQRIAAGRYDERVAVPPSDELAAMAASFNQMADALEQVELQRVTLIGNVAHELRTPLAGLEGYLEGMVDGVIPHSPETFSLMQHEVRRLRRLVEDLQTLSRVETGQVALHPERFDGIPLVQRVVAHLRPQISAQSLEIVIETDIPTLPIFADPDRTAQILLNLIGNAIRYTPEGGRIVVRVAADADKAQIVVHDTGIGIPPESLPYVFERFYRVDRSRARSSGGSGIGLTIARHLAWAMGGEITAASAGHGQGSVFTLFLPLSA